MITKNKWITLASEVGIWDYEPDEVVENLRTILEFYEDVYGEYGFYDSITVEKQLVNHQYLLLDQALSFLAISNHLTETNLQTRFHADPVGRRVISLLSREEFSILY